MSVLADLRVLGAAALAFGYVHLCGIGDKQSSLVNSRRNARGEPGDPASSAPSEADCLVAADVDVAAMLRETDTLLEALPSPHARSLLAEVNASAAPVSGLLRAARDASSAGGAGEKKDAGGGGSGDLGSSSRHSGLDHLGDVGDTVVGVSVAAGACSTLSSTPLPRSRPLSTLAFNLRSWMVVLLPLLFPAAVQVHQCG